MVYEGQDKFFGKTVVGVLVEMFDQNDEAVLRTKDQKVISVDIKSLKAIICQQ
jgi:DNA-binding transcriptional regulator LsrR (DeoR family)